MRSFLQQTSANDGSKRSVMFSPCHCMSLTACLRGCRCIGLRRIRMHSAHRESRVIMCTRYICRKAHSTPALPGSGCGTSVTWPPRRPSGDLILSCSNQSFRNLPLCQTKYSPQECAACGGAQRSCTRQWGASRTLQHSQQAAATMAAAVPARVFLYPRYIRNP